MVRLPVAALFLIVSLFATLGYFALGPLPAAACYLAMSALALLAVPVGLRLFKPRDARPWLVLGAAQLAFLVADALWYANALGNAPSGAAPSLADAFYLSGYPLLAIGLIMFIRGRQPHFQLTAAIDAMYIGIAAVLVLWLVSIDGIVHDETIPFVQRVVEAAYPIGDVLVLSAAAYLVLIGRNGRRSLYLLVASIAALLAADVLSAVVGSTTITAAPDALTLSSYALFGLAALGPSMRDIGEPSEASLRPESNARLLLVGGAIAVLPAFALYEKFFTNQVDFALIGVTGAITILATLLRMHELGAVLGRAERRYAALLANASDAFAVVSGDGRFRYVSPASERVLGYPIDETMTHSPLDFVYPKARTLAQTVLDRVASKRGAQEEMEVRVRHADGRWRWLNVTVTNRTDDPIVDGIVLNYRDITAHKGLEDRLHRQAFSDALTGLANRPLFIDRLEHALARRRRDRNESFAVLFLDVDDFKVVNDNLGHSAGDTLLITLGQRLRSSLRPADTAARFGGDEFAVLLEGASEKHARHVADRLLNSLGAPVTIGEHDVRVTVSIGVAVDSNDAEFEADDVMREADLAMYSAKTSGPGTYAVYEPQMHEAALRRLDVGTADTPPTERQPTAHWQPTTADSLNPTPAAA